MRYLRDISNAYDLQMEQTSPTQSPAEKVLEWAQDLSTHRESLEQEASRVEMLLESIDDSQEGPGADITIQLVEVLSAYVDGIDGLLEYDCSSDQEILEESLALLVQSSTWLDELEEKIEVAKEAAPLVA